MRRYQVWSPSKVSLKCHSILSQIIDAKHTVEILQELVKEITMLFTLSLEINKYDDKQTSNFSF